MIRRVAHRILVLALGVVVGMGVTPPSGQSFKDRRCQIDWRRGTTAVRRLVACVARVLPNVAVSDALAVAGCESGFQAHALSPSGSYGGVFQQSLEEWAKRARLFGFAGRSVFDAEANTWVSLRAVRYGGWAPWECKP